MNFLIKAIASGLGTGYSPVAPGTAGSALPAVLALCMAGMWSPSFAVALSLATFFVGVAACHRAERFWGHDNGKMVIDEIAGMFLTLAPVGITPGRVLVGFLLFRLFDIVKPPPARQAEKLPGGWGVMTDDMVAGLYAALFLWGMARWM